jgi:hypothetical protein
MRSLSIFFIILFALSGCASQNTIQKALQTNNAHAISYLGDKTIELIMQYKQKLDKRNPKGVDTVTTNYLPSYIQKRVNPNEFSMIGYKTFDNPSLYLQNAFESTTVEKNDYLIMGMYAMVYEAYNLDAKHKLTAFDFNLQKLQTLHKNLQILKWKIKVAKDSNNNFLFLTWQNNWQVELLKNSQLSVDYASIENLRAIASKQESVFDISNTSFDEILRQMLVYTELAIHYRGGEATDISVNLLTSFLLL